MRFVIGPAAPDFMADAVRAGGGTVVGVDEQPEGAIWLSPRDADGLRQLLDAAPSVRWVQLPFAGIEAFLDAGVLTPDRTWTCAKGVYAEPTAEHAMALTLAGLRRLTEHARASSWGGQGGRTLYDADVVILGGGGITSALLGLLAPYRCSVTVVRRDASTPLAGAARTVSTEALDEVLPGALVVVLALALTPETVHVIGSRQLELMDREAWLVNVARGRHVDTDALVKALQANEIGGAALDVTDPEPLPDDSPLWRLDNCLVTPHTANPWSTAQPLLSRRITDNVRRYVAGEPLLGLVDLEAGY